MKKLRMIALVFVLVLTVTTGYASPEKISTPDMAAGWHDTFKDTRLLNHAVEIVMDSMELVNVNFLNDATLFDSAKVCFYFTSDMEKINTKYILELSYNHIVLYFETYNADEWDRIANTLMNLEYPRQTHVKNEFDVVVIQFKDGYLTSN